MFDILVGSSTTCVKCTFEVMVNKRSDKLSGERRFMLKSPRRIAEWSEQGGIASR